MSITGLIGNNSAKRSRSLACRYPRKKLEAFDKELRELVEAVGEDEVMPSAQDISDYFRREHDMDISNDTVISHLRRIKKGETWQALEN